MRCIFSHILKYAKCFASHFSLHYHVRAIRSLKHYGLCTYSKTFCKIIRLKHYDGLEIALVNLLPNVFYSLLILHVLSQPLKSCIKILNVFYKLKITHLTRCLRFTKNVQYYVCFDFVLLEFVCTALSLQLWRTALSWTSWVNPLFNFSLYSGFRAKFNINPGLIGRWSSDDGWPIGFTRSNFGRKDVRALWKLTSPRLLTFKLVGDIFIKLKQIRFIITIWLAYTVFMSKITFKDQLTIDSKSLLTRLST